jgi:hypothetical protein
MLCSSVLSTRLPPSPSNPVQTGIKVLHDQFIMHMADRDDENRHFGMMNVATAPPC